MAKTFVIPIIRREDYDAFRNDARLKLTETYEQWSTILANEISEAKRLGDTIIEAVVNYDEFVQYCATHGHRPDPQVLLNFVRSKPIAEA